VLRLSPAESQAWREDGFFVRESIFDAAELAELRDAAERAAERALAAVERGCESYRVDGNLYCEAAGTTIQFEHRPGSREIRVIEPVHLLDARFEALLDDARLAEPMRDLIGQEEIAIFTDKLNLKRPREGSRFLWHQDSPYWAHFCRHLDRLPNVLVAFDDAGAHNGCFRVIRGSHRRGLLPGRQEEGVLGPLFTDPRCFDESDQVPCAVPAGSAVFFSPHTVHGSEPNHSDALRRAIVLTYQPGGHRMLKLDATRRVAAARA
jgi:phytanoyl-CoA hydroxylase